MYIPLPFYFLHKTVSHNPILPSLFKIQFTPQVLSPFRGEGIAYLKDPDSYAGWSFYTPDRASQAREVAG